VDQNAWMRALVTDVLHESDMLPGRELGSIFFGGGTPSLMPPATVAAVIESAGKAWRFASDIEITLEANPSSVEAARFADLAAAGVNRASLGLQSLDDDALRMLGRAHSVDEGLAALDVAQHHFDRVSFDLIYALPGQTPEAWDGELCRAIGFGTTHLSLYELTIEPGTRFATEVREGRMTPLDGDRAAELFEHTRAVTAAAGLPAYEVSNHAAAGAESRHNLTYWRYGDYAGVGPGAHGRRGGVATVRHKKPENWISAVERNGHGIVSEDALDWADRGREALVMGLRLTEGIDLGETARRLGVTPEAMLDDARFDALAAQGLTWREGSRVGVTERGILLLDAILAEVAR
jgi:putative oxygen-independent coproporphyrinogen III oxidase